MKRTILASAGVTLLAACGGQAETNAVSNNVVEAVPANAVAPTETSNVAEPANASAANVATPVVRPTPDVRPQPAPGADKQIMPLERRTDRVEPAPAPAPEPAPAPKSSCTPEHEAMGHCKQ